MRSNKHLLPVLAAAFFCACFPAGWRTGPAPAPVKKEAPVKLSAEDAREIDQLYYKAVGAYSNNDMELTLKYLDEISVIQPSYQPAAELRKKIKSVSGSK